MGHKRFTPARPRRELSHFLGCERIQKRVLCAEMRQTVTPTLASEAALVDGERAESEGDELLAARCDAVSFTKLYRRHAQSVYRYVAARVGSRQAAEDVTSEAFKHAWSSRGTYRSERPFRAWLFGIVRHVLADHHRHARASTVVNLDVADRLADDVHGLDASHDQLELQEQCARLLALLNPEQQEVLYLRFVAELSYSEIAVVLGKREDAVKKTVYRARDEIRRRFKVEG